MADDLKKLYQYINKLNSNLEYKDIKPYTVKTKYSNSAHNEVEIGLIKFENQAAEMKLSKGTSLKFNRIGIYHSILKIINDMSNNHSE